VSDGEREVLTPAEVTRVLRIGSRTLSRWVKDGKIAPAYLTPGRQRRYWADEVAALAREAAS
jgi:excisionase family DNA binding protein